MATEYERKRLENIRRNDEMMAALNVHSKASLLSAVTKRIRDESKPFKNTIKKEKSEEPVVIRQSLRKRGLNPDFGGLPDDSLGISKRLTPLRYASPRVLAPLPLDLTYEGEGSHSKFVDTILGIENRGKVVNNESHMVSNRSSRLRYNAAIKEEPDSSSDYVKNDVFEFKPEKTEFEDGFALRSLTLEPDNVARVVPGRILVVKFLPCEGIKMIAAGDLLGNVGFWNLDCDNEEDDGIYLFRPHTALVSSLMFQQKSLSKVISSSYDGLIRLMDVEKLVFDLVYSSDENSIFSLSQRPNDEQSLYFGEGNGIFKIWDLRAGKLMFHWALHKYEINSIDFNPQNPHIMATSSADRTACLWDLRSMGAKKPKTLRTLNHAKTVQSAYFSPTGLSLATTSIDNYLGILSGANFEDTSMIYHNNKATRYNSSFRGIWGWDDSYIFVGNTSKGIDVISTERKRTVMELQNPLMKAVPSRLHFHPLNVGMIAGSTVEGEVYVWTTK